MALNSDVTIILNDTGSEPTATAQALYNCRQAIITLTNVISELQNNKLQKKIVEELPSETCDENTIYLVPSDNGYDAYLYVEDSSAT